jgi:outer membrane protein assembly factor BamB
MVLGVGVLIASGLAVAYAAPALAATNFYAYASGAATSPSSCPKSTSVIDECTLTQALTLVAAGDSVLLATPGSIASYYGNFSVATATTSSSSVVTIGPASGVSNPVIDGDASGAQLCPTKACDGAALTVDSGVHAALKSLTITDADSKNANGGGGINDLGTLSLTGVTISNSRAYNGGGVAIDIGASLTATGATFSDDSASSYGGAIENGNTGTGTLNVSDSTFSGDTAAYEGGAVENGVAKGTGTATVSNSTFAGDSSEHGGAIENGDGGTGTLTVTSSTFSADSATARGGAIDNGDAGTGTLTVETSTFSGDSTTGQGAAIDNGNAKGTASALILSSTIAGSTGNAAIEVAGGTVQIAGSIVADSSAANCAGTVSDAGYNLEDDSDASCGFSERENDLVGVSPDLGSLADNGGPTQTLEPSATSPVLNAIPRPAAVLIGSDFKQVFLCPLTDQTGAGSANETYGCSIGSVDPANSTPVVTSMKSQFGPAAGGANIMITGGNFASGATVQFGTASATNVTVVSPTDITATTPAFAGPDGAEGVAVTVSDPSGATSTANPADFYSYYSADWSAYLGGPLHSSYNPAATSITTGTIKNLQPIWQWSSPKPPNIGSGSDFASPIVYDGVVYVGIADGEMYAINESTQQVVWSQYLGFVTSTTCTGTGGITGTATVAIDQSTGKPVVYVNAPDGYMYALDAATGTILWNSVVGIPSTTVNDYYAWGSPTVANGKVYVGIASRCDNPLVPAGVLSFDQHTGTQIASWDSQPAGVVGGSVWSSVAVLPDGDVVATTGNSKGTDQIPNAESMVVLDGNTLKLLDAWEVPKAQQIYDSDFGGSPTVFTAYPSGVATTMVGACNKDGYYYAFRADDIHAGPLWEDVIGGPASEAAGMPGECDAAAIWNGHELIEGGGTPVSIDGTTYNGSVQALNPTTGALIWETGLPGYIIGTPSLDGGGVIAAPVYYNPTGSSGVYLLSQSTGAILDFISTAPAGVFAQPVFDGNELLVGDLNSESLTAYAVTTPGQSTPVSVAPSTIDPGSTDTLTITGASGLTSPANVIVSGAAVRVASVKIVSSTEATVKVVVLGSATAGIQLNLTLVEPNLTAYGCTSCLTVG